MLLDPQIRDWVLLPILLIVLIVNYARMYAHRLLAPSPESSLPVDAAGVRHRAVHAASLRLRQNGAYISHAGWAMRKHRLIGVDEGGAQTGLLYDATVKDVNPMTAGGSGGQMDMVKMMVRAGGMRRGPRFPPPAYPLRPCDHLSLTPARTRANAHAHAQPAPPPPPPFHAFFHPLPQNR